MIFFDIKNTIFFKHINEIVDKKRICLVGPSNHLYKKNIGNFINDFDVVCRVNHINNVELNKDYGNRTDILFHTLDPRFGQSFFLQIQNNYDSFLSIKKSFFIWYPNDGWENTYSQDMLYHMYFGKYGIRLLYDFISKEDYFYIRNKFDYELNSGMFCILMLSMCDVKEFFVTGFSFYEEYKQRNNYRDCYFLGSNLDEMEKHNPNPFLGHNQEYQKSILKKILNLNQEKIMIDSNLNFLLNLNHKYVKEL